MAATERFPRPYADRRAEPRVPLDVPVRIRARGSSAGGRTVDASAIGLLVELCEPLSFLDHHVGVEVSLSDDHVVEIEADVVRRAVTEGGSVLLALRLVTEPGGRALARRAGTRPVRDYSRRHRESRARPRQPRPPSEVRRELRALARRVLELALTDPEARPPIAMAAWVTRLGAELGQERSGAARTNRLLMRAIADLHRASGQEDGTPSAGPAQPAGESRRPGQ